MSLRMLTVTAGLVLLAIVTVRLARCRHRAGVGLLPPMRGDDGTVTPARWYCADCHRTWPAGLERSASRPVPRFTGYDQSKAPAAAAKADECDRERQARAVIRSGVPPVRRRRTPADVVRPGLFRAK